MAAGSFLFLKEQIKDIIINKVVSPNHDACVCGIGSAGRVQKPPTL
jgi:hypothetical protein